MYVPKSREEYISMCRYYDGTEESLEGNDSMFASYEKYWVEMHYTNVNILKEVLYGYKLHGLGRFSHNDGVPITLKALLWSRFSHWNGYPDDAENFKVFYQEEYLKIAP